MTATLTRPVPPGVDGPTPELEPMGPKAPAGHHSPLRIAPDTYLIRSMLGEREAPVAVYVHSMVIAGPEPVVVDTGTLANREQWSPS